MKRMEHLEISHAPGEGTGPTPRSSFVAGSVPSRRGLSGMPWDGQADRRRGVALIIVLGFLSVMVVMAVAFLTQARVERLVSGTSLESMRSRQMTQTALAAAMQDYLNALKQVSPADTEHDVFLSGDQPGGISFYYSGQTLGNDRLVIGKVEDWLLNRHLTAATGGGDPSDAVQDAEWIWVREEPGARSRILGRYAYACFDMSGQLDANLLGNAYSDDVPPYGDATNRNNVRKMVYEAMDKSVGGNNQLKLNIHQQNWRGFDTPAALLNLTDGSPNDGQPGGGNRWSGTDMDEGEAVDVSSLVAYSYAVLHMEDGSGNQKIPCTASAIQGDVDFNDILAGGDRAEVIKALDDYEDADSLPQGGAADYPSAEAVPMFNEIGARVSFEAAGPTGYQLVFRLQLEFWYPFPSEDNETGDTFTMAAPTFGGGTSATGPTDIWLRFAGGTNSTTPSIVLVPGAASPSPGTLNVSADFNDGLPYFADNANGNGEIEYTVPLTDATGNPLPANMYLFVRTLQIKQMDLNLGGTVVDSTPDQAIEFDLTPVPAGVPAPTLIPLEPKSQAVDDPRLNHEKGRWSEETPSTPEGINASTYSAFAQAEANMGIAPGQYFYCRNGPIERPAELGYLPSGTPWESLDVFNEDGIRLMNRVVCDSDEFDILQNYDAFFTNGTINPYTRDRKVLNAAFYGLDMREVPNMGTLQEEDRFTGADLDTLIDAVMQSQTNIGHAGWGSVFAAGGNLPAALNKNVCISLMNRTWGLFNESDRLFVVAVIAQAIKEGADSGGVGNWDPNTDIITGERRAVALCWMDGSQDKGGDELTQEMNVIMFQYLNE